MLEELDYSIIDVSDFYPTLYSKHCVGGDVFSTVYAWNTDTYGDAGPQSWADFFDVEKFPGKRGLRKSAKATLEMALMADVYRTLHPEDIDAAACITGKPPEMGGIAGRTEATGRGVQYAMQEFFRHDEDVSAAKLSPGLNGKRVVVQGLGNVGYHAAKFLEEEDGCQILGIIEWDGGLWNEKGLNVESVSAYIRENGGVKGYPDAEYVADGTFLLEADCDILVPAALESQIHEGNAAKIKANLIVEAANGPVTAEADEILRHKGKIIIPDMYANAGGVTVSYFEWTKNLAHMRFGKMGRRFMQARADSAIDILEQAMGDKFSEKIKQGFIKEADELNLVRSGLDDSMRLALQEIIETRAQNDKIDDYRTLLSETQTQMLELQEQCDRKQAMLLGNLIGWFMHQCKIRQ